MKTSIHLAICLLAIATSQLLGQDFPPHVWSFPTPSPAPNLTTFDLDFAGGSPADLVSIIEKATGKPLNVIIPAEDAAVLLPPLKMSHVNVADLFSALGSASRHSEEDPSGRVQTVDYGFGTESPAVTDDSVWFFRAGKVASPFKVCLFFDLTPYLSRGFTVDDLTTAIRTGWQMLNENSSEAIQPSLSFHKETKLLIAVGSQRELDMVRQALDALPATTVPENEIVQMKQEIDDLKQGIFQIRYQLEHEQSGAGRRFNPGANQSTPGDTPKAAPPQ